MAVRYFLMAALMVTGAVSESHAEAPQADSVFLTGRCPSRADSAINWDLIVSDPETTPRLVPSSFPLFPLHLRRNGYSARVVLGFVIDTVGRVMSGTVRVMESTDAPTSAWACLIALNLRYTPAMAGGKPVNALGEQPLGFSASVRSQLPVRP